MCFLLNNDHKIQTLQQQERDLNNKQERDLKDRRTDRPPVL